MCTYAARGLITTKPEYGPLWGSACEDDPLQSCPVMLRMPAAYCRHSGVLLQRGVVFYCWVVVDALCTYGVPVITVPRDGTLRGIQVDVADGTELGTFTHRYRHGQITPANSEGTQLHCTR